MGTPAPIPSCTGVERRLRAAPLRKARFASGRLYRRLSGGRILDAMVRHHADPAWGTPTRDNLLIVGSGIRVGLWGLQDRMDHANQLVGGGEDVLLLR